MTRHLHEFAEKSVLTQTLEKTAFKMTEPILLPRGFRAAGRHCGVKADPDVFDLALFAADTAAAGAGVFTLNRVCGAPVKVSRERVPSESLRAVVINSGIANACTGRQGVDDARHMTAEVAQKLGCPEEEVLVCSTGVIGRFLPMEKLSAGIPALVDDLSDTEDGFKSAARGMMTTDSVVKRASRSAELAGGTIRVSGAAKGAAMIGPNMATMLSVIMTDAKLSATEADTILRRAVDRSFNCISVEGHTSTSDSVILLASGAVPVPLLGTDRNTLRLMVDEVAQELAQAIVRDAEGGAHFVTVDVRGLRTREEALRIAKTIANDALVKTAIAGADPNWGRIVSCAGRTGVDLQEKDMTLRINGTLVYESGAPAEFDAEEVSSGMRTNRDVHIELVLPFGDESVRFWTSDLTQEYVRLNSEATT